MQFPNNREGLIREIGATALSSIPASLLSVGHQAYINKDLDRTAFCKLALKNYACFTTDFMAANLTYKLAFKEPSESYFKELGRYLFANAIGHTASISVRYLIDRNPNVLKPKNLAITFGARMALSGIEFSIRNYELTCEEFKKLLSKSK